MKARVKCASGSRLIEADELKINLYKSMKQRYWKLIKNYKGIEPSPCISFFIEGSNFICYLPFSGQIIFPADIVSEDYFTDYFAEVNDRWKPADKGLYFYINDYGVVVLGRWDEDHTFAKEKIELGNVFETEADARFCRDEFIKKAFDEYHKNYPPGSPRG